MNDTLVADVPSVLDGRVLQLNVHHLSDSDALRGTLKTVVFAAAWAALTVLIVKAPTPWLRILAQALLGIVFAHGLELQHECLHTLLFSSRRFSRAVGVVLGMPMLVSYTHYQIMHLHHHRYLGTRDDAELFDYDARSLTSVGRFLVRAFNLARVPAFLGFLWRGLQGRFPAPFRAQRSRVHVLQEYVLLFAVLAFAIVYSVVAKSWLLVHVWLVPWLVFGELAHFLIELPEHLGCNKQVPDVFENTRTMRASPFVSYLVNGNNYHVEHHLFPTVAFRFLPLLHRSVRSRIRHHDTSYARFYFNILRSIGR